MSASARQMIVGPRIADYNRFMNWSIWDTVQVATGVSSVDLFSQPKGQGSTSFDSSGSKQTSDTNMVLSGQLQNGEHLWVYSVSVFIHPTNMITGTAVATLPEDAQVLADGIVTIELGNNLQIFQRKVSRCPAGGGMYTQNQSDIVGADGTTVAAQDWVNNGYPSFKNQAYLRIPIELKSQDKFSVKVDWGYAVTLSATGCLTVKLNGYLEKGLV